MTSHTKRRQKIKRGLSAKGWTHTAAAKKLGVTYEHLNRVLNGHRESERLLIAIDNLPAREEVAA